MIPLVRAAHAQPSVAVTAIATALAVSAGRGAGAAGVALAVLSGQLSVGWSNDWLDRRRDREAGRSDKPLVAGQVTAPAVALAAALALAAAGPLSFLSGWRAALVHLGAVGVAWAYNLGVKATAASPLPYALAFGALPAFVTLGLTDHPWPPAWSVVAAALLGTGAHFVNTLPDLADDVALGVCGLPHRLGARRSLLVGAALLAASALVVVLAPAGPPGRGAGVLLVADLAAVTAVAATAGRGHGRTAWSLTLVAAGLTVALLLAQGGSLADRPTEGREARPHDAVTVQGMPRVRVSTTVDADSLRAARQRTGGRDSELFDQALMALLDALDAVDAEAEIEALTTAPQGERADPPPGAPPGAGPDDPSTPDDDARAPADVVQLADRRRARRAR